MVYGKAGEIFVRKSEWKRLHGDLGCTGSMLCLTDIVWASLTLLLWSSGSSRGLLETPKCTLGYLLVIRGVLNIWATFRLPRSNGIYAVSIRSFYFRQNFQINSLVWKTSSMTEYRHLSPTEWRSCVVEFRQLSVWKRDLILCPCLVFNRGTNRLSPNVRNLFCAVDNV
jgi:hypothetical protein